METIFAPTTRYSIYRRRAINSTKGVFLTARDAQQQRLRHDTGLLEQRHRFYELHDETKKRPCHWQGKIAELAEDRSESVLDFRRECGLYAGQDASSRKQGKV